MEGITKITMQRYHPIERHRKGDSVESDAVTGAERKTLHSHNNPLGYAQQSKKVH